MLVDGVSQTLFFPTFQLVDFVAIAKDSKVRKGGDACAARLFLENVRVDEAKRQRRILCGGRELLENHSVFQFEIISFSLRINTKRHF